MHLVKLDNGLYIDEKRIESVTDVRIKSSVDEYSKVTVEFYAKIDGLDNIEMEQPKFVEVKEQKNDL